MDSEVCNVAKFEDEMPKLGRLMEWWVKNAPHYIWIFCSDDKCWSRPYRFNERGEIIWL